MIKSPPKKILLRFTRLPESAKKLHAFAFKHKCPSYTKALHLLIDDCDRATMIEAIKDLTKRSNDLLETIKHLPK